MGGMSKMGGFGMMRMMRMMKPVSFSLSFSMGSQKVSLNQGSAS
jgi:hypothetical protein